MGWNDVRVNLLGQGRTLSMEEVPQNDSVASAPLRVLHVTRTEVSGQHEVPIQVAQESLEKIGFEVVRTYPNGDADFANEGVIATICTDGVSVDRITLTFPLSKIAPRQFDRWKELTCSICGGLGMTLFDSSSCRAVNPDRLLETIAKQPTFQEFAERHAWTLPTQEHN